MPFPTSPQAREAQAVQAAFAVAAAQAIGQQIRQRRPWSTVLTTMAGFQLAAVSRASQNMADWLDAPTTVLPRSFAGVSAYGFPISEPIIATIDRVSPAPAEPLPAAWWDDAAAFTRQVEQLIYSEIQDAARSAAQVEMVSAGASGYVRLLNPPSCRRCVPLAGRFYRWSEGFERHPECDCIHVPADNLEAAIKEGFVADAHELFERGEIQGLTVAESKAIADGADIAQVVNATRGTSQPGITGALSVELFGKRVKATTEATTKRGLWRQRNPSTLVRLRPESIYRFAKDQADAQRLLATYGYIT